jgi:hypothetical protein
MDPGCSNGAHESSPFTLKIKDITFFPLFHAKTQEK